MKEIQITSILRINNEIKIEFSISKELEKFFSDNVFYCKYDFDTSLVPESISVIPFIVNVLPIIWLTDSTLIVNELDKTFANCIESVKNGYSKMYPKLSFKGGICYRKIIDNKYLHNKNAVLFSGGIDALCTLLRHYDEKPELITLWGSADFPLNDIEGWKLQKEMIIRNSQLFGLDTSFVQSNFCEFIEISGRDLNQLIKKESNSWWHDFQHGIGIIGHAAPIAYVKQLKTVYIASSFYEGMKPYHCASDPTIDNYMAFSSCGIIHDGYELTRQDKIKFVIDKLKMMNLQIDLHVCLRQHVIKNCCHCEKCYRTICGLIAEGEQPSNYGFSFTNADIHNMIIDINKNILIREKTWKDIQQRYIENKERINEKDLLKWFMHTNFDKINRTPLKVYRKTYRLTRSYFGNILRRLNIIK